MQRCMLSVDNTYSIPNLKVTGYLCKTNIVSSTAFRGFGGPQGIIITENVMADVAMALGMEPDKVGTSEGILLML